jgi:hypothetical protein
MLMDQKRKGASAPDADPGVLLAREHHPRNKNIIKRQEPAASGRLLFAGLDAFNLTSSEWADLQVFANGLVRQLGFWRHLKRRREEKFTPHMRGAAQ